ncbi:MAG: TlpA disulfide reductase family protein [Rubrivivax sp.]
MDQPLDRQRRASLAVLAGLAALPARAADAFEWRPWPEGRRPPPLPELPLLGGGRWALAAQSGHRLLLANFWASWCGPCREELPLLLVMARDRAPEGLRIVGINYKEPAALVRRFLDRQGLELPVALDADGQAASAWTPRIFPSTVLFDHRNQPLGTVVGEIDWTGPYAARILDPLLAHRS